MNVEEETYKKFGYHSSDLAPQSHKYVISRCIGCGEIREIQKRHDPGYCRKCAQSKEARHGSNRIILTGDWHIGAGSVDFDELKDVGYGDIRMLFEWVSPKINLIYLDFASGLS